MTRDEIIRMALEAGLAFPADEFPEIWQLYMDAGKDEIIRFANLVAEAAAAADREAMREKFADKQMPEPEPVAYLYTNLQSGEYHVSDYDDDYRGPERVLWCIEPVYRRAKGQA